MRGEGGRRPGEGNRSWEDHEEWAGGQGLLDGGGDAGGAGVAQAESVGWGGAQAEEGGIEKTFLGTEREVGETLAEGDGEQGEENAVHDDVPAMGLTGFDGFLVALEGAAPEGAQASELGAAEMAAGFGEGRGAEVTDEPSVELDEFADLATLGVMVGVTNGWEFDGNEQSFAVTVQEGVDRGEGFGFGRLDEVGECREGRDGFGGADGLGERVDVAGEVVAGGGGGGTAGR